MPTSAKNHSPTLPAASPCHCTLLRRVTRQVTQHYDTAIAESGLKISQYALLGAINRRGTDLPTVNELAEAMGMDRSTLGHNLRPLERGRLVEMTTSPDDRRTRRIGLSAKGRSKLDQTRPLWLKAQAAFDAAFGAERAAKLREILLTLAAVELA